MNRDIFLNFLGRGCSALALFLSIPIFIDLLGIEAYGLIGLYQAFLYILLAFDFGIGMTVTKEISGKGSDLANFLKTGERFLWIVTCTLWGLSLCFHQVLRAYCTHKQQLDGLDHPFLFIFFLTALFSYWPLLFYCSILTGLHKQKVLNGVNIIFVLIRFGGAIALLHWRRELTLFFIWQIGVNLLHILCLRLIDTRYIPFSSEGRIDRNSFFKRKKFALSLATISLFGIAFTQMDKIFLVRILSLKEFAHYCVIASLAGGLLTLIGPFYHVLFPQFTKLIKEKRRKELIDTYFTATQLLNALIFSFVFFILYYGENTIVSWTHKVEIAQNNLGTLYLLTGAFACFALLHLPHALQLAYGWSRLHLLINTFLFPLSVPLLIFLSMWYGSIGAAAALTFAYSLMSFFSIQQMHQKILKKEIRRWIVRSVLFPLLVAACSATAIRALTLHISFSLIGLCVIFLSIVALSFLGLGRLICMKTIIRSRA